MFNLILLWWRMKKNSSNGNYFKFILFLGVAIIVYALGFMDIGYRGFANIDLLNYRHIQQLTRRPFPIQKRNRF